MIRAIWRWIHRYTIVRIIAYAFVFYILAVMLISLIFSINDEMKVARTLYFFLPIAGGYIGLKHKGSGRLTPQEQMAKMYKQMVKAKHNS